MQNEKDMTCKNFEIDLWLYLDNELPGEKMEYWRSHLKSCADCANLLKENERLFSEIDETAIDIEDEKFEMMIEHSVSKRRFFLSKIFSSFIINGSSKASLAWRVALTSVLVVAAIIISLNSRQPNAIKSVGRDLLDWDSKTINIELSRLRDQISNINQDKWGKEVMDIDTRIDLLEQHSDPLSFE